MGTKKQIQLRDNDIISASEIGQFQYCSISWYLQRCGYAPKSPFLSVGKDKHVELGKIMYHTQINMRKSKIFIIIAYLLLFLGILFLVFEVIL